MVKGFDLLQVRTDIGVLLAVAGLLVVLKWLFFLAMAGGVARGADGGARGKIAL